MHGLQLPEENNPPAET